MGPAPSGRGGKGRGSHMGGGSIRYAHTIALEKNLRITFEEEKKSTNAHQPPKASSHKQIGTFYVKHFDSLLKVKFKNIMTGQLAFLLRHSVLLPFLCVASRTKGSLLNLLPNS